MARPCRNRTRTAALSLQPPEFTRMTTPIAHLFDTHEQARQAAARLEQSGISHDQISLVDQHSGGRGGTLLTVQASAEQAALVADLLPGTQATDEAAPQTDMSRLNGPAPAHVAGGIANLGTPGPG
ncbi:MAG TPA: hypothetical protein VGC15_08170 [Acetobacteraceae bacterium]